MCSFLFDYHVETAIRQFSGGDIGEMGGGKLGNKREGDHVP